MNQEAPLPPEAFHPPSRGRLVAIGFVGMAALLVFAAIAILAAPAAFDRARTGRARVAADGMQELTVELANGVYRPNVLRAKAGAPLRLHVVVRDRHSCASKLLVPDLKLDFDLPPAGSADLLVPAAKPGSYLFTCGQKMVKGSLVME